MSTNIAQQSPAQQLVARVRSEAFQREVSLALPEGVRPERFVRVAVTALLYTPDVAQAEPASVIAALLRCAQDGLLPDGHEAALVVYKHRAQDGLGVEYRAQYLPMVGGLRRVAADHGWSVRAAVVYKRDEFSYALGDDPRITHIPVRPNAERGERIAAYAVGAHKDGRREIEVLEAARIEQIRAKAKTQAVWNEWPDRMWEKTVAKALVHRLPLGELDERALRIIAASRVDPEEAAATVYGPPRPALAMPAGVVHVTGEIAPDPGAQEGVGSDSSSSVADTGPQVGAATVAGPQAVGGPDREPDRVSADPGDALITFGAHNGLTLRQLLEQRPEDASAWLAWALRNRHSHDGLIPFAEQIEEFCRHLPGRKS